MDLDFTAIENLTGTAYSQEPAPEPMTQEQLLAELYNIVKDLDSLEAAEGFLQAVEKLAIKRNNPRLYGDVVKVLCKQGENLRNISREAERLAEQEDITPARRRIFEKVAMYSRHNAEELDEI